MRPWTPSTLVAVCIITSLHTYTGVVSKATGTEAKILPNSQGKDMEIQFAGIRQELKSGPTCSAGVVAATAPPPTMKFVSPLATLYQLHHA